jgi:hypothetical protein
MMQTVLRTEAQGSLAAHQAKIAEIRTAMWGEFSFLINSMQGYVVK